MQDIVYIGLPPGINFGKWFKEPKLPRCGIFGLPLTHRVKILQKIKSGTSHITHHTSQITYCIWSYKFYKILVIKRAVPFNNSLKLILKKFVKYFFMKIIEFTIQTSMSSPKFFKPTISLWNKALSEKFEQTFIWPKRTFSVSGSLKVY